MRDYSAALAAGFALPFAFAPFGFYPITFVSLAILFSLWRARSPWQAARIGFVFGLGMFGYGAWWIQHSIHQFGLPLYSFSVTATALFAMIMSSYIALAGYLTRRLPAASELHRLCLLAPALWVLTEWIRGWLFSGFPWLNLGYSQTDSWLAGLAPLIGAYGISLACALIAAGLVASLMMQQRLLGLCYIVGILGASYSLFHLEWTQTDKISRSVALIQGSIPQTIKWVPEYREATLKHYAQLSEPHWGKSIVIWPESALPAFPDEIPENLKTFSALAEQTGTALLVGIPTGDRFRGPYFNSVLLLNNQDQKYDKHHLVPYGEYLPYDEYIRPLFNFLTIPMSAFASGAETQMPISYRDLKFGVSICYEDAYTEEVTKALPMANMLVNVSDDAWFGDSIAPHQHLQISRMRALEAGRYLLRATNTGISAIIDQRGKVQARSPQFKPYALTGNAYAYTGATPFVRVGNWPTFILAAFFIAAAWWSAPARSSPPRDRG